MTCFAGNFEEPVKWQARAVQKLTGESFSQWFLTKCILLSLACEIPQIQPTPIFLEFSIYFCHLNHLKHELQFLYLSFKLTSNIALVLHILSITITDYFKRKESAKQKQNVYIVFELFLMIKHYESTICARGGGGKRFCNSLIFQSNQLECKQHLLVPFNALTSPVSFHSWIQ